ncbi:MAG: zinc ribbon domain-containing protein [Anaerolineae bacterium]
MARKTLGYTRLEWTCPNCGTRNPGPQKTCLNCRAPQPEDLAFEQPAQEELITDEAELAQAKAGPDIHCFYCGTRNPAGATTCSQCGGDLTKGTARRHGQVVGAHRAEAAEPVVCPSCGTANPADAPICEHCGAGLVEEAAPQARPAADSRRGGSRVPLLIALALALVVCGGIGLFIALGIRTEDMTGTVSGVSWTRSVAVEELRPVTRETWLEDIPSGEAVGVCTQRVHHVQDEPAPNAEEVCGTPYTVDTGSGFGEVVQDCEYRVLQDWCEYTVDEWQAVDEVTLTGQDLNPQWPLVRLAAGQREGARSESYQVFFKAETGALTYRPDDFTEFSQYQIGSRWILQVNTFNDVLLTEPVR